MENKESCFNCKFISDEGRCRRYPPDSKRLASDSFMSHSIAVHPDDWCGEYKAYTKKGKKNG